MKKLLTLLKNEKTSLILILVGLVLIVFAIITFLWLDIQFNADTKIKADKFGQFGDFIGGFIGSIWALAGVILFYIALTEQREDIKTNQKNLTLQTKALEEQVRHFGLQTSELESSRKIYEQQNKTLRLQQFESNFYSLLNIHLKTKENLNKKSEDLDFFKNTYDEFKHEYNPADGIDSHHGKMVKFYLEAYSKHRGHLAHYFKSFYRILKVIDSSGFEIKEKYFYAKILRSFLSEFEQLILYYNSHSVFGTKAQPLILKYNILKNTSIFTKPHFDYYSTLQSDDSLFPFSEYLTRFLENHINNSREIDFNEDRIVEKYDPFNLLIGIYFDEQISIKIFCSKDLKSHSINLSKEVFNSFLLDTVFERIILNTYSNPENVTLKKFITDTEDEWIVGVTIETESSLIVNSDLF